MEYEELERKLKKIAETVKEFPAEIREKAFDIMFSVLVGKIPGNEKDAEIEEPVPDNVVSNIAEEAGLDIGILRDIYESDGEGLKIYANVLKCGGPAETARVLAKLLFLYKRVAEKRFQGMTGTEIADFIKGQEVEINRPNLIRDLRRERKIFGIRSGANTLKTEVRLKHGGYEEILVWLKGALSG